jgi:hypothetical protein
MSSPDIVGLRSRMAGPAPLFGIFTRLTDPVAYETIALTDVGVLMIDAEHGSFGRATLAQCIFALRCAGKYVLVRLPDDNLAACARDSNIDFAVRISFICYGDCQAPSGSWSRERTNNTNGAGSTKDRSCSPY